MSGWAIVLAWWLLAAQPAVTPLGDGPPPATTEAAPARALPAIVTVCTDRATQRCWTAAGGDPCAGGTVFGRAGANQGAGAVLTQCWQALRSATPSP